MYAGSHAQSIISASASRDQQIADTLRNLCKPQAPRVPEIPKPLLLWHWWSVATETKTDACSVAATNLHATSRLFRRLQVHGARAWVRQGAVSNPEGTFFCVSAGVSVYQRGFQPTTVGEWQESDLMYHCGHGLEAERIMDGHAHQWHRYQLAATQPSPRSADHCRPASSSLAVAVAAQQEDATDA